MTMPAFDGRDIELVMMKSRLGFSRAGDPQIEAFVFEGMKVTLLDVLWVAIAYGKKNKKPDAIESIVG